MLGLLGGLIGRAVARPMMSSMARRPLGGLLANRIARNAINPRQSRPSGFSNRQAPEEAEKPQPGQPAPEAAQEAPQPPTEPNPQQQQSQPPAPPQPVEQAAQKLQEVDQDKQQTIAQPEAKVDARPVTADLLDAAPPAASPEQPQSVDKLPPPPQVANQTDTLSPVAPQADQQFGRTPELFLSGLVDRIGDQPPRRFMAAEDPVPAKPADVKSQARHTGNRPEMSFGLANSSTSYTPSYTYRR